MRFYDKNVHISIICVYKLANEADSGSCLKSPIQLELLWRKLSLILNFEL